MSTTTQAPVDQMPEATVAMPTDQKALEMAIELTKLQERQSAVVEFDPTDGSIAKMNIAGLQRLAAMYAASKYVPEFCQEDVATCSVLTQLAYRMKVDPVMLMQNSCVIHKKPGIEGKLAIALLNISGKIRGRIRYEVIESDAEAGRGMRAIVTDAATGDVIVGPDITWKIVKDEGWYGKPGSKWKTMPDQMFRYRSATWLIRAHYPEVLMGLQTKEELQDVGPERERETNGEVRQSLQEKLDSIPVPEAPQPLAEGEISLRAHVIAEIDAMTLETMNEVYDSTMARYEPGSPEAKQAEMLLASRIQDLRDEAEAVQAASQQEGAAR